MPRSGWYQQQCSCGSDSRARVAISIQASTLGITPRKKTPTITIYLCAGCMKTPKRPARRQIMDSILLATKAIGEHLREKGKKK